MQKEEFNNNFGVVEVKTNTHFTCYTNIQISWTFKAKIDLPQKSRLRFLIPRDFPQPQINNINDDNFISFECSLDKYDFNVAIGKSFPDKIAEFGFKEASSIIEKNKKVRREISFNNGVPVFVTLPKAFPAGESISLHYDIFFDNGRSPEKISFLTSIDPAGKGEAPYSGFYRLDDFFLPIYPSKPEKLLVVIPSTLKLNETFKIKTSLIDKGGQLIEKNVDAKYSVPKDIILDGNSGIITNIGDFIINAEYAGIKANSNICEVREIEEDNKIFWGDIHLHSNVSDGALTPKEQLIRARDTYHLDFASITDHDDELCYFVSKEDWDSQKKLAKDFSSDSEFIALMGSEYSERYFDGDRNVYYRNVDVPVLRFSDEDANNPNKLWNRLKKLGKKQALTIPHHPSSKCIGVNWEYHDSELERLVEIFSCWGSSEGDGCPRQIPEGEKTDHKSKSVKSALEKGFKFGIVASGDMHAGYPGCAGKVAVLAKELSRESIFNALWNRNVYATTGDRIILDVEINGHKMGEAFFSQASRNIKINVKNNSNISKIVIVKNSNETIHNVSGNNVDIEIIDYPERNEDWIYIRVECSNKELAWSSPFWIKK